MVEFFYTRVSASDQTAAHQLQKARAAGFGIDEDNVIKDEGVSGISTCFAERDGGRRLSMQSRPTDGERSRHPARLDRHLALEEPQDAPASGIPATLVSR
jgi:putative DNA-invertase from lambdoid prophage Rac